MNTEIIVNDKSNLFWRAGLLAFALFAFVCAKAIVAAHAQQPKRKTVAKTKQREPRTIYDFYLRLPAKFFPFLERVKDRRDFVDSDDRKNDYLSFGANVPLAPEHAEMILLKRMNGDVYIVVSFFDHRESDGKAVLHFLEYNNGRFTAADAAPPLDLERAQRIYRRKTGESAPDDATMIYKILPVGQKHHDQNQRHRHLPARMGRQCLRFRIGRQRVKTKEKLCTSKFVF